MAKMGLYCKAYPTERFKEFSKWEENAKSIPLVSQSDSSSETPHPEENSLRGRFLFLQENFTVTESIFLDEQVVFDQTTEEWKDFCRNVLEFEVPAEYATSPQTLEPQSGSTS